MSDGIRETASSPVAAARRRSRFRAIWLAPVLVVLALGAWVFASPAGASPDDDYHLISIWCAAGERTSLCEESGEPTTRMVSPQLIEIACFARLSEESAACQYEVLDRIGLVETRRGDFVGAYPPVYYGAMSLFASDDILSSMLVMRFVNVLLFAGITAGVFALLPSARRRTTLVWGWLVSMVPLAAFLIASNNPSAWAVIGVGSLPLALIGHLESAGRRRVGLGVLAVLATVIAAGARADAAVYAVLVAAAVVFLRFTRTERVVRQLLVPGLVGVVAVLSLLVSAQILSALHGFGGSVFAAPLGGRGFALAETAAPDLLGLLFSNVLNTPSLWAGVFGYWALGWFDTPLPEIVAWGGVAVFVAACFTGLRELTVRKALVVAGTAVALWVIPVFTLTRGGDVVGVEVQPRYLLPLIVVLAMFTLLSTGGGRWFSRAQTVLMGVTLAGTYTVALFYNMRRYVTGADGSGANLGAGAEWWWTGIPNPMIVFAIGVLAWSALLVIVLRETRRAEVAPIATSVASAP